MPTTVTVDDDLVAKAKDLTGIQDMSELLRVALKALIHREASQRLARMGGSMPDAVLPPRRRPPDFLND
jgi:Arc/MetJ family transcription regulator